MDIRIGRGLGMPGLWERARRLRAWPVLCALILWGVLPRAAFATGSGLDPLPTDINFGDVEAVTGSVDEVVTGTANGGDCDVDSVTITGADASHFSIPADDCSGNLILDTTSCEFTVRFSPDATGALSGEVLITGFSGCNGIPPSVTLAGTGIDEAPSAPTLVFPEDGATGVATSLTFIWEEVEDPQGDPVTYTFFLCEDEAFTGCDGEEVALWQAHGPVAGALGGMGLLLVGFLVPRVRRRSGGIAAMIAAIFVAALWIQACTSSSDGSGSDGLEEGQIGHSVSGLSSNTTYYWKVAAADDQGNSAESDTFSFTTE